MDHSWPKNNVGIDKHNTNLKAYDEGKTDGRSGEEPEMKPEHFKLLPNKVVL